MMQLGSFTQFFKFFVLIACTALTMCAMSTLYTKSACVIVHGTWAQGESWHKVHGDFFKSVVRCAQELQIVDEVVSFSWSGQLGYLAQLEAAQNLAKIIWSYDFVILIGHSHGVTVGILASQIIGKKNPHSAVWGKIKKFYALGVPVDATGQIYPDMVVVGKFYNLFSFGDYIQPVNGAHERCFAPHERLANIAVMVQDQHPSHSQLHDGVIGKELLKIEEYFASRSLGGFQNFCCIVPSAICFYQHDVPQYCAQYDQSMLLELDKKARWMMTMAFFRDKVADSELL